MRRKFDIIVERVGIAKGARRKEEKRGRKKDGRVGELRSIIRRFIFVCSRCIGREKFIRLALVTFLQLDRFYQIIRLALK